MTMTSFFNALTKPTLYTPGTKMMWTDKHISKQLLDVHLNPDIDLASRKPDAIARTVDWIQSQIPGRHLNMLDLGCGPGLYTEAFARQGHKVTGMDFSEQAIAHARQSACDQNLDITYVQQNYLTWQPQYKYDLITMIFMDFGVLLPDQRDTLLGHVHKALKPGGVFIFDVLNNRYQPDMTHARTWETTSQGFWSDTPYLALSETHLYENDRIILSQHVILDQTGHAETYRFWTHTFTHQDLHALVTSHGFHNTACHEHVLPDSSVPATDQVTFVVTHK